jgi:hypothetical protein
MAILYGAMLANLLPTLATWWTQPTELAAASADVPGWLRWLLTLMAAGVFASGVRDLYASWSLPLGAWPWRRMAQGE